MRKQEKVYSRNSFLLHITKLLLFCVAILVPVFIVYVSCSLNTVIVEGNTHYTQEEAKSQILTKKTDGNTLLFYLRYKYGRRESIPFVADVDVKLVDKNTVKIRIYEKAVTGCIKYMGGYMYFDKDGIIVESSNEKLPDIPYIEGLNFSGFVLYSKLEVEREELFGVILKLTQLIQKFELKVETIQFNEKSEVTLVSGNNKVLLGKRDTYDEQLAELKPILPKAEGKKIEIDMKEFTEENKKVIAKPIE